MEGIIEEGKRVKPRRQHTQEFTREAIRLSRQPGMGPSQVAKDLGINRTMLSTWIRQADAEGGDAFRGHGNRPELDAEVVALKRRVRVLEEERDILKNKRPPGSRSRASEVRLHRGAPLLVEAGADVPDAGGFQGRLLRLAASP